jgi:hypothetical protein
MYTHLPHIHQISNATTSVETIVATGRETSSNRHAAFCPWRTEFGGCYCRRTATLYIGLYKRPGYSQLRAAPPTADIPRSKQGPEARGIATLTPSLAGMHARQYMNALQIKAEANRKGCYEACRYYKCMHLHKSIVILSIIKYG